MFGVASSPFGAQLPSQGFLETNNLLSLGETKASRKRHCILLEQQRREQQKGTWEGTCLPVPFLRAASTLVQPYLTFQTQTLQEPAGGCETGCTTALPTVPAPCTSGP